MAESWASSDSPVSLELSLNGGRIGCASAARCSFCFTYASMMDVSARLVAVTSALESAPARRLANCFLASRYAAEFRLNEIIVVYPWKLPHDSAGHEEHRSAIVRVYRQVVVAIAPDPLVGVVGVTNGDVAMHREIVNCALALCVLDQVLLQDVRGDVADAVRPDSWRDQLHLLNVPNSRSIIAGDNLSDSMRRLVSSPPSPDPLLSVAP